MAKREHYYTQFEEGRFYHVYNRAVDKQAMFRSDENYEFFLNRYDKYISPVADTYTYCLLKNHFHILIKIKEQSILQLLPGVKPGATAHAIVSHQFRKFFQSYALAFNTQHERIGTLFQTPFKRALVDNDSYFTQLVYYIHANPQRHGLIDDFRSWRWSSYSRVLIERPSRLMKQEVIEWFGGKDKYKLYHDSIQKMIENDRIIFGDD